jgi:hypothetical protein
MSHRLPLALTGLFLFALAAAQPPPPLVPGPPPPKVYDARITYRIDAYRNERVRQYDEMMRYLAAQGFRREPVEEPDETEAENVAHTSLVGTVPADRARNLAAERHVRTVLLVPHGAKLPEKAGLVRADLTLRSGFAPDRQFLLHEQAREVLASLNFREAVGYDHRGFTRLVGAIPADRVDTLMTDLRKTPAGARQGPPFTAAWPLRLSEIRPDLPLPVQRPRPPAVPAGQEKLTADLREVVAAKGADVPRRLEVILASGPTEDDRTWRRRLARGVPGIVLEGRVGPVVTVLMQPAKAPQLAALDDVIVVRLPRAARPGPRSPRGAEERWTPLLETSGLARLFDMRRGGKGVRVALVDSDFGGWEKLVGSKLPAHTRLVDLTAERSPDLLPEPFAGKAPGAGTLRAETLARAAPEADLTLIRVDPAAPYMIYQAARAIAGDEAYSISLENRLAQLNAERGVLDQRREDLAAERKRVFSRFEEEGEAAQKRQEYLKKQQELERDERDFTARLRRYLALVDALRSLKGIRVVASGLVWDEGFPVDGTSALSRYFDDRPFHAALWFQAAGDARGQSWTGPFRDVDGNGVLEFASPEMPLPTGAWTNELDFLGWRSRGQTEADLPAGARLRIAVQWREAHDGHRIRAGEDPYREPLARVRIVVLRQLDPAGARRPADDMEVVAQSSGLPQRLSQTLWGATYEQSVELTVPEAGRYAVRVEGRPPEGTQPRGEPSLADNPRHGEMYLRLFVTTLAGPGRAVWQYYATDAGSVGMPADARQAVTVGAADPRGGRQPYSAGGAPFALDLLAKPDVLAFDDGEGTAEAAAFAAGLVATASASGPSLEGVLPPPAGPGALLRVPSGWPRVDHIATPKLCPLP